MKLKLKKKRNGPFKQRSINFQCSLKLLHFFKKLLQSFEKSFVATLVAESIFLTSKKICLTISAYRKVKQSLLLKFLGFFIIYESVFQTKLEIYFFKSRPTAFKKQLKNGKSNFRLTCSSFLCPLE